MSRTCKSLSQCSWVVKSQCNPCTCWLSDDWPRWHAGVSPARARRLGVVLANPSGTTTTNERQNKKIHASLVNSQINMFEVEKEKNWCPKQVPITSLIAHTHTHDPISPGRCFTRTSTLPFWDQMTSPWHRTQTAMPLRLRHPEKRFTFPYLLTAFHTFSHSHLNGGAGKFQFKCTYIKWYFIH